ncbi:hypothetical protein NSP_43950 [Nodularia spumigena CCY9414]|nr:hypothetical protein NSP_43950 [Nodularia spumigena CCY9414]
MIYCYITFFLKYYGDRLRWARSAIASPLTKISVSDVI